MQLRKKMIDEMKKTILSKYLKNSIYTMEESKAEEFDNLFDTMIMLLRLNHNLTYEVATHHQYDLTLYARNKEGISDFSFKFDTTLYAEDGEKDIVVLEFHIKIVIDGDTDIDLTPIEELSLDGYLEMYSLSAKYDEDLLLKVMREIVQQI
jgi:hypothetical protein